MCMHRILKLAGCREDVWEDSYKICDAERIKLKATIAELEKFKPPVPVKAPAWLDTTKFPYEPTVAIAEGVVGISDPREIYASNAVLKNIASQWKGLPHDEILYKAWYFVIDSLTYFFDVNENWQFPIVTFYKRQGDCLMPDTPVIVNRNGNSDIIEVSKLKEGDWIFTGSHRGNGNTTFSRVNWIRKKKTSKNIYRLRTARSVIDITEDHLVQVKDFNRRIFIESKNVAEKRICMPKNISKSFKNKALDYDIGWIYGLFAAEGYCGGSTWRIFNTDREMLEKAKNIMNGRRFNSVRSLEFEIRRYDSFKEGAKTNFGKRKKELYVLVAKSKTHGSLKKFCEWQRNMFYTDSKHKKVPYCILNGSEDSKRGFLDGHYIGDRWCSTSKILMFGMSVLTEKLGMKTAIHDSTKNFSIEKRILTSNKRSTKLLGKTEEYVYDLNVDDPHLFCAGDVVVHNCEDGTILFVELCRLAGIPKDKVFNACGWYTTGGNAYGHSFPIAQMEDGLWYIFETTLDSCPSKPLLFKGSSYDCSWGLSNDVFKGKLKAGDQI